MYDLHFRNGDFVLVWSDRKRRENERGMWVSIGHSDEQDIERCVQINRENGLEVALDEEGFYRALILRD